MTHLFHSLFEKHKLLFMKSKAMRHGIWFKSLSRLDRGLVNLTIKLVDRVRSPRLSKALSNIVRKLEDALEKGVTQATYKIGFPLARRLGLLAKKWGNPLAEGWISDIRFARFLAIIQLDNRSMSTRNP